MVQINFYESPTGMQHIPDYVKEFLQNIPAYWDDSKFIDGYPGKFVIIAHRGNNQWFISNGEKIDKELTLDLNFLPANSKGYIITDGDDSMSFRKKIIPISKDKKMKITIKGNEGFVMLVK